MRTCTGLKLKSTTLILGLVLAAAPVAADAANIRVGRIQVLPSIEYRAEYNDNIFNDDVNAQDDVIHTVRAGAVASYAGSERISLEAGYNLDLVAYQDFDDNNYQTHTPFVRLRFESPMGFYLEAGDTFTKTEDPYGSLNQFGLGQRTERWDNAAEFRLGYRFARRYGIEAIYDNYRIRFDSQPDKWQDRTAGTFGARLFYQLTGKTQIFGEFRRTVASYDEQNDGVVGRGPLAWSDATSQDNTVNDVFGGVRLDSQGKLSGEVKLGYTSLAYDNMRDKDGNRYEDEASWAAQSLVRFDPLPRTRLTLALQRAYLGSPDADANAYIDTAVRLSVRQGLMERLRARAQLAWNNNDYVNMNPGRPAKELDTVTFSAALEWDVIPWLTAGLEYAYKSKDANDPVYANEEYDSNAFAFFLRSNF